MRHRKLTEPSGAAVRLETALNEEDKRFDDALQSLDRHHKHHFAHPQEKRGLRAEHEKRVEKIKARFVRAARRPPQGR